MAVLVDDLLTSVLTDANSSDKIVIITGYFSPDIIDKVAALGKPFEYYYGMYGVDKIRKKILDVMRNITSQYPNLKIAFVNTQRVHTKCYLYYKNGQVFNAMVGSANCSTNGLCSCANAEMLAELNLGVLQKRDYLDELEDYYKEIQKISIDINDPLVKPARNKRIQTTKTKKGFLPVTSDPLTAIMPLYAINKVTGARETYQAAGPNWGNQNGNVSKNRKAMEAYIPILAEHLDYYPLLFQAYPAKRNTTGGKITRKSDPVTVIWDDGTIMTMTFQGTQRSYPSKSNALMVYPKQLSYADASPKKGGAELGAYLRNRMNVGPFHVITVQDLDDYGRDHVLLRYVSPGLYQADFSGKRFRKTRV